MIFESTCHPDYSNVESKSCKKLLAPSKDSLNYKTVTSERMTDFLLYSISNRLETTQQENQEVKQVFLFADSVKSNNQSFEAALTKIRNQVAAELKSQGLTVVQVPAGLELTEAIAWINRRKSADSIALSIQADAFSNPNVRGTSAFYKTGNERNKQQAEQLVKQILVNVPTLVDRGVRPDAETAFGNLPFLRQITIPSIVLTLGFSTNPLDRSIILNRSQAIAQGIADGIAQSNRTAKKSVKKISAPRTYSPVSISLNGKAYNKQGIILEGNAYVPIRLLEQLTINIKRPKDALLVTYNNVTYVRAIDLRGAGILVGWNPKKRTVILGTASSLNQKKSSSIMGRGYLSKDTLEAFLQQNNSQALQTFPEIVRLYLEEASIEGVNSDIAFTQALLETNFFRFDGALKPSQNNFAALGAIASTSSSATFPNARTGVRAHIQLLKTYASMNPFAQEVVTPQFRFIARGIAPQIEQLSFYYSTNPSYAEEILAILKQLYQYQLERSF